MADLDDVIDALYAVPPDTFVDARTAAVAAAREHGDRAAAAALGKLRRPNVTAWLANQLVRTAPDVVAGALALGPAMREATVAGDRAALRDLSRHRAALLADLAGRARGIAEEHGQGFTSTTQRELEATFTTAAGDDDAAEALLAGRLVAPLQSAGLGFELGAVPPERPAAAQRSATAARDGDHGAGAGPVTKGAAAPRPGSAGRGPGGHGQVADLHDAGAPPEVVDDEAAARGRAVVEAEQDLATARLQDADAAAALEAAQGALAEASAVEQEAAAAHRAAKAAVSDARADLTAAKADVTASGRAVASALSRLERARSR